MLQQKHIHNINLKCISRAYPQSKTTCIDMSGKILLHIKKVWAKQGLGRQVWFFPKHTVSPREILQFLASFKLGNSVPSTFWHKIVCINMNISLLENWQFHYKLAPPLLHMLERFTIWKNMKLRAIQNSQFSNFLVNHGRFESTTYLSW